MIIFHKLLRICKIFCTFAADFGKIEIFFYKNKQKNGKSEGRKT